MTRQDEDAGCREPRKTNWLVEWAATFFTGFFAGCTVVGLATSGSCAPGPSYSKDVRDVSPWTYQRIYHQCVKMCHVADGGGRMGIVELVDGNYWAVCRCVDVEAGDRPIHGDL